MKEDVEILIVDTLLEHITLTREILERSGYKVYAATSGKATLEFLETREPDLILLDSNMVDQTGGEVCLQIKEKPETMNIPVIFLTTEYSPEKIKEGFAVGGCDYIQKPFIEEEYLARIKAHINSSREKRELLNAYKELNLFCATVAHDLKSPLSVMNTLIEILKDEIGEKLTPETSKIINLMSQKSEQLILLVERLLEFSRMCNIKPQMQKIDLKSMVEEIMSELKALESKRNMTMSVEPIPEIWGDEVLVNLMLKNIMINAFKFTRYKEEGMIRVKYDDGGSYHVISIEDNGVGFDGQYANRLFSIFQRLHDQELFEGSGVGLAMVDRIMKRHGGKVSIEGEVDQGAKISLYFLKEPQVSVL